MARLGPKPHKAFADLLKKAEREGWGYHDMIMRAANLMKSLRVEPQVAIEMMEAAGENVTRRPLEPGEVRRAVGFVYNSTDSIRPYDLPKTGTKVEPLLIDEFSKSGSIKALKDSSDKIPPTTGEILSDLYESDALLHLSPHPCQAREIKSRDEWVAGDLEDRQYICPAHLKSREMGRTKENVLYRHFIVYESDRDGLANNWDAQAGMIKRLSKDLPLKLVCWSGNKSLHSWFDCSTRRKDHVQSFISLCVQLGADPACLRPAQLVRLPWGIRSSNQKIQKVIYYAK